ncbi:MAG: transketolase [Parachlamydiales bacterium]|jgi:transketolase
MELPILEKIALSIRSLSMEAVQKAGSGHPGLPLGCAEIGAYLYAEALRHNPGNPFWLNRDRFVLSAGHGSMLLYSLLHLSGFGISLEDLKSFRQLHSKTAGHPEYKTGLGIEATTGPLGQGVGNAAGLALAYKILAEKFNTEEFTLFDNKIYCLAGDGCLMEGVSHEAFSLAGHWNLNNLIVIYDANNICLDGPVGEVFSEDLKQRFASYGFDLFEIDGHSFADLHSVLGNLKAKQDRPVLIVAKTIIGKGAPNKAGTHKVHGSPLGLEELKAAKAFLKLPEEEFYVPQAVRDFFSQKLLRQKEDEKKWEAVFGQWSQAYPEKKAELEKMLFKQLPEHLEEELAALEIKEPVSGRAASGEILNFLSVRLPFLYGGSADLSCSDMTLVKKAGVIGKNCFKGRNLKYGVREFAMGTISNGLALSGFILPYAGTFLVFSDYLRGAIRLAALSSLKVIYQLTHDSIFLGEDGPTHQPIEQLASLRALPNLQVIRPADSYEVKMAWLAALRYEGPSALILSRQNLTALEALKVPYEHGLGRGAYIIKKEKIKPDFTFFASGSEVKLALEVAARLENLSKDVRVVSVPSFELFERQPEAYKNQILKGDLGRRVSLEAASEMGWHKFIGTDGIAIALESFGLSAPSSALAQEFGFTLDTVLQRLI